MEITMMNAILFAGGMYAKTNGIYFVLAVTCGYLIARHYYNIDHRESSGFLVSVLVGTAMGILLDLDNFVYSYHLYVPLYPRILIGFVGACLGYGLFQTQVRLNKKATEQHTDGQDENRDTGAS